MTRATEQAITAIVPAHGAEGTVGLCLDGLLAAGFSPDRIVVVDDASPDGTVAVVRSRGIEPVLLEQNSGAAAARNAGAAAASGAILFFVDSDVVVGPDAKARVASFFKRHPDHAGVFGSYDDAPPAPTDVSRIRNLLHHHTHQRSAGVIASFWSGCGALRRTDFEAAGSFRTADEMIEDVGIGLRLARLGRPVVLDPNLLCTHLKQWTWKGFARTDYRHRAMPWTRMMRDPANAGEARILSAGGASKRAVVAVAVSIAALPLILVAPRAGLVALLAAMLALILNERGFLALVARKLGYVAAARAVAVLWVHYAAAGAGYARVRLLG